MRAEGYYWVKGRGHNVWSIAELELSGEMEIWTKPGVEGGYTASDFDEIDERRIERDQNPCWCKLDALALKNSGYIE